MLLVLESDVKIYNTIISKRISLKNLACNDFCPTFRSKSLNRHLASTYCSPAWGPLSRTQQMPITSQTHSSLSFVKWHFTRKNTLICEIQNNWFSHSMSLEKVLFLESGPHAGPTFHTVWRDRWSIPRFLSVAYIS